MTSRRPRCIQIGSVSIDAVYLAEDRLTWGIFTQNEWKITTRRNWIESTAYRQSKTIFGIQLPGKVSLSGAMWRAWSGNAAECLHRWIVTMKFPRYRFPRCVYRNRVLHFANIIQLIQAPTQTRHRERGRESESKINRYLAPRRRPNRVNFRKTGDLFLLWC